MTSTNVLQKRALRRRALDHYGEALERAGLYVSEADVNQYNGVFTLSWPGENRIIQFDRWDSEPELLWID